MELNHLWGKSALDGINERYDTAEKKITELEDIKIKLYKMKHKENKTIFIM